MMLLVESDLLNCWYMHRAAKWRAVLIRGRYLSLQVKLWYKVPITNLFEVGTETTIATGE